MINIPLRGKTSKHQPRINARKICFTVKRGPQAACFDIAFHRFVELKGRTMSDPNGLCSIESHAEARGESKAIGLWSRKAVRQFRDFWPRYARVYGAESAHGMRAASGVRVA